MHCRLFLILIVLFVLIPVNASELVWKENIKPLTLKSSYTKFNDFFLYNEDKESESWAKFSLTSKLAQEGNGWGYSSLIQAYHSASSIKNNDQHEFDDKGLSVNFKPAFYLSSEQRLYLNLDFSTQALLPGEGITQFLQFDEQLTKRNKQLEVSWRYGSELSPRYFDARMGYYDESYDQDFIGVKRAEYKSYYLESELGFAYTTASHILVNLSYSQDRYEFDDSRDANYINSLVGLSWNPSKATHLRFLLGYFIRQFEQQGVEDNKGLSWKLSATWSPVDRFSVTLDSSRNSVVTQDQDSTDSLLTSYLLSVRYQIAERANLSMGLERRNEEFNNAANVSLREIDDTILKAEFSYEFKKSWLLALSLISKDKNDSSGVASYDQSLWALSLQKEY